MVIDLSDDLFFSAMEIILLFKILSDSLLLITANPNNNATALYHLLKKDNTLTVTQI